MGPFYPPNGPLLKEIFSGYWTTVTWIRRYANGTRKNRGDVKARKLFNLLFHIQLLPRKNRLLPIVDLQFAVSHPNRAEQSMMILIAFS